MGTWKEQRVHEERRDKPKELGFELVLSQFRLHRTCKQLKDADKDKASAIKAVEGALGRLHKKTRS